MVARLVDLGVTRLVDVRLTPISRKPGLSKTALGREPAVAGTGWRVVARCPDDPQSATRDSLIRDPSIWFRSHEPGEFG